MRLSLTSFFLIAVASVAAQQSEPPCRLPTVDIPALTAEAESGNPQAELGLAWALEQKGTPEDHNAASYWLNKAAEHGQADALWILAMNYRDGRGVERNEQTAFDLFLKSAQHGNVDAQYSVAQMYERGDVVPQDYVQAVKWYKKAAEHVPDYGGAGHARNSLGELYAEGNGVRQDYVTAYMYFALAQNKGNMRWIAGKMTSSAIAESQSKAKEWMLKHPQSGRCSDAPAR